MRIKHTVNLIFTKMFFPVLFDVITVNDIFHANFFYTYVHINKFMES